MSAVIEHEAQPESSALIQVIERAASNPSIDVEKMERLLAMQERVMAKQAESEFNTALTAAQAEMSTISADATNPQTRSKYATYAKLDRVLRPIYTKHGFCISYDTDDSPKPDHVRVLAYVSRGGYTRTYKVDMPADGKGAKGGDVMTKTHAAGSAMSYGMRYLLKAVFNVAVGEEDDDGNNASSSPITAPITAEQAKNLQSLAQEVGADIGRFLKYVGVESIEDLPRYKYEAAKKALEKKRSKK